MFFAIYILSCFVSCFVFFYSLLIVFLRLIFCCRISSFIPSISNLLSYWAEGCAQNIFFFEFHCFQRFSYFSSLHLFPDLLFKDLLIKWLFLSQPTCYLFQIITDRYYQYSKLHLLLLFPNSLASHVFLDVIHPPFPLFSLTSISPVLITLTTCFLTCFSSHLFTCPHLVYGP